MLAIRKWLLIILWLQSSCCLLSALLIPRCGTWIMRSPSLPYSIAANSIRTNGQQRNYSPFDMLRQEQPKNSTLEYVKQTTIAAADADAVATIFNKQVPISVSSQQLLLKASDNTQTPFNSNNQNNPPPPESTPPPQPPTSWKRKVHKFLAHPLTEVTDCVLVLVSSFAVALSTVHSIAYLEPYIKNVQDVLSDVFVVEFMARWFASSAPRGRHLTQPLVLVDVVVVILPFLVEIFGTSLGLPSWLTSSTSLINLRLLRILRLQRVLQNMNTFSKFEAALGIPATNIKAWQLGLARVVLSIFTLLSVASGLIYSVEHQVNPLISDYFTALYFGLTTLTTGMCSLDFCLASLRIKSKSLT
jgi:hypothetical protein